MVASPKPFHRESQDQFNKRDAPEGRHYCLLAAVAEVGTKATALMHCEEPARGPADCGHRGFGYRAGEGTRIPSARSSRCETAPPISLSETN